MLGGGAHSNESAEVSTAGTHVRILTTRSPRFRGLSKRMNGQGGLEPSGADIPLA